MVFKAVYRILRIMQIESIAECSKGSILEYFRPSLSYSLSLIPLFCLFWVGHVIQVLLYLHLLFSTSVFKGNFIFKNAMFDILQLCLGHKMP